MESQTDQTPSAFCWHQGGDHWWENHQTESADKGQDKTEWLESQTDQTHSAFCWHQGGDHWWENYQTKSADNNKTGSLESKTNQTPLALCWHQGGDQCHWLENYQTESAADNDKDKTGPLESKTRQMVDIETGESFIFYTEPLANANGDGEFYCSTTATKEPPKEPHVVPPRIWTVSVASQPAAGILPKE